MIFDVARHKFSEGLITLMFFALVSLIAALSATDFVVVEGGAPLRSVIDLYAANHPVASALLMFPMLMYAGLRFARVAVRVGFYSASSLGLLALAGVSMFACTTSNSYASLMVVVLLISELFGRLLYCFGSEMRLSYLFTALLSAGIMPLVDSTLIPAALALPLVVIVMRGTIREAIVVLVGVSLPTFVYCYLMWLYGGEFSAAFVDVWSLENVGVDTPALLSYLTMPRLVFLGLTLLLGVCSLISYFNSNINLADSARVIWRLLISLFVILVAISLLLPVASPAVVVFLTLLVTLMLPQLFIRIGVLFATITYLIWVVSALATLF